MMKKFGPNFNFGPKTQSVRHNPGPIALKICSNFRTLYEERDEKVWTKNLKIFRVLKTCFRSCRTQIFVIQGVLSIWRAQTFSRIHFEKKIKATVIVEGLFLFNHASSNQLANVCHFLSVSKVTRNLRASFRAVTCILREILTG